MRLLRYGAPGREKPGLLDADGKIRDLSGIIEDIGPDQVSPKALARLARLKLEKLPLVRGKKRIGPCIANPQKFIAIGLNYSDHAKETKMPIPSEPVVFTKHVTCINGPDDDVVLPKRSKKSDWEVELGIVIGTRAKNVAKARALSHVAGYCLVNDVSERENQLERGGQWTKGKSHDTFGPIGPWFVTADEVRNPHKLSIWLELNGKRMQDGNTSNMIFRIRDIVSYVSRHITLVPGDLICTGTPPGVGAGMKPQVFLKPGDVMHLGIDGLGHQTQKVVREK